MINAESPLLFKICMGHFLAYVSCEEYWKLLIRLEIYMRIILVYININM